MKFTLDTYPRTQKVGRFVAYLFTPELQVVGLVVTVLCTLWLFNDGSRMLPMDEVVFPSEVELEAMAYFGPDAMNPPSPLSAADGGAVAASGGAR